MEATIQSTNRAINIDINVSINVDALKAIIQRGWQAIKQRVLSAVADKFSALRSQFSVWRVYRHQLRLARAIAWVIDAHPTISNIALWVQAFVGIYLIFMYA